MTDHEKNEKLPDLGTPGGAFQALDGYSAGDLSGPPDRSITDAEAPNAREGELELNDPPPARRSAIRGGL